jgi:hypothetical protein
MQTILDHLDNIVLPAIRDYFAAEEALDAANAKGDAQAVADARFEVIRKARTAAVELHHLADFVVNNPAPGATFADLAAARAAIRSVCVFARGTTAVQDRPAAGRGRRAQTRQDGPPEFERRWRERHRLDRQRLR